MSLKNLQEISSVVTNYTKKPGFLNTQKATKSDQLIAGLLSKAWESEDDAEQFLYGNPLKGRSFDMLKSRAKEQLINSIFLLDTKRRFKSSYDKSYFLACKNLVAGLILLNRSAIRTGRQHLTIALQISQKYHFTDFTVSALRLLRYSTTYSGQGIKYNRFNNLLQSSIKTLEAELRCEELNQKLILEFVLSAAAKSTIEPVAYKCFQECKKLSEKFDTYTTRLNMYRVGIRYYDSINDFKNVIKLAEECESYLDANKHLIQKIRLGEMNLHKLYSALHLRDYKLGTKFADRCSQLFDQGSVNWLFFLEYFFLLCLHTENSNAAKDILRQVTTHKNYKNYPTSNIEKWKIFEAFLNYALPESKERKKHFNTSKFVNEVPIFSKDKAGYNLSIIIAQVILLVKQGDFGKVIDKAESLKLYASRYIRKERSPRSYYFLKMLLVMIKYEFDPVKTEQIASKFYEKLKLTHLGEQNELETLEVIPYDLLWPKLIRQLHQV